MQYFNRNDREQHVITFCWSYLMETWLENNHCLSKDELKWLKTARTYVNKALASLSTRCEPKYKKTFMGEIVNSRLYLRSVTAGKPSNEQSPVTIDRDDFNDLCELAVNECVGCTGDKADCKRYELFVNMHVPMATIETDKCPYSLRGMTNEI